MKIIGHRGARGLETENSLKSFKRASALGVDGVEFDVWTSKDDVPVVSHDSDLVRLTGYNGQIFDMTLKQIKRHRTFDGQTILTGQEALDVLRETTVFFEIKDYYLSSGVLKLLDANRSIDIQVTSFNHNVLIDLKKQRPDLKLYPSTIWHPLETLDFIRNHKFYGLNLNYRFFNPLVYQLAKRYNIKIRLYTVNNPVYVRLLKWFGYELDIGTDYPDRMLPIVKR